MSLRRTLLILLFAGPVLGSEGVLEINQTCAAPTGCFEGDEAGFPVLIKTSGSDRLTSNLRVAGENANAIELTVENVTLDLNGSAGYTQNVMTGNNRRSFGPSSSDSSKQEARGKAKAGSGR